MENVENVKNWLQIVQAVVTIIAVLIGLAWFIARRRYAGRANITHVISHGDLDDQRLWIRSKMLIQNCGEVMLSITAVEITVCQVKPDPSNHNICNGPFEGRQVGIIDWHVLDSLKEVITLGDKIVDPGETDEITFDSIVPIGAEIISISTHIDANALPFLWSKHIDYSFPVLEEHGLGWTTNTTYDLSKKELK